MGGCASKPKDSHVEPLDENPASPKQILKSIEGDVSIENKINSDEKQKVENEHEEEKQKVENEHKEEPLLVDLSDPKPDAANPAEDSTAKELSTVTDLVPNITGSNSDAQQDLQKDSGDPQKVPEIIHVERKAEVVNETADQPKDMDQAQDSQTTETATTGTEIETEMQKPGVKGEGPYQIRKP